VGFEGASVPLPKKAERFMTRISLSRSLALILSLFLSACGGPDGPGAGAEVGAEPGAEPGTEPAPQAGEAEPVAAETATVRIVQPAEGAAVEGPGLRVILEIGGMQIRPAGDMTPNSGHHHLYLDHDLTDPTQPIPAIPGQVIHMGDGSSEFVFEGVTPGEHRLIAVVGNHIHFPLQPWVVDTVSFVVR